MRPPFGASPQPIIAGQASSLPAAIDSPTAWEQDGAEARQAGPSRIICALFYALVLAIPFETLDIGISLTPSKLLGYLFFLAAMFQPRITLRRPPKAVFCFALYLYAAIAIAIFQFDRYQDDILTKLFASVQMMVLLWLAYNMLRHERVLRLTLRTLALACVLLALLQLSGIARTTFEEGGTHYRISTIGQNPNELAATLAIGFLALLGLAFSRDARLTALRYAAWPVLAVIPLAIVQTGSRGGILALTAGLLVYLLQGGTIWIKLRNALIILAAMGVVIWGISQSEVAAMRWERALEKGNFAHRERLFPAAWEMFMERPVFGWGTTYNLVELHRRVPLPVTASLKRKMNVEQQDVQNVILWVLTETGLAGGIPFIIGVWLWLRAAWQARDGLYGALPLAMTITMLQMNMSGAWLYRKLFWLLIAFALASASQAALARARARQQPLEPADGDLAPMITS
ncbi:MAG TPA: O-antigen ligase family protein [Chthonomonadaceae bacterium]|nr:O-antigen ligase family protein [Chthonomonadaceae bacterium]